jgi:hypothetical protein
MRPFSTHSQFMLRGGRATRRRALLLLLALFALADLAFAVAVMRTDGSSPAQAAPLPMHPIVGSFVPDDTQLSDCSSPACFQQAFGNISYREGPKPALALANRLYHHGEDPECHRVSHFIGAAALVRFDGDVARALAAGDATCWSGYYHGVLERALVKAKSVQPAALAAVARPLCTHGSERPIVVYGCLHGLGHGLMIATGLNLPTALEVCARLGRWWDRDACRGGVFMENISTSYGFHSTWLKDDDPLYPCDWVAHAAKRRCYLYATSRILPSVNDDWNRTAAMCMRVERGFVDACFQSLGRDASSRSGRDPEAIVDLCSVARPFGHEGDCVQAASYDIVTNFASGKRGQELCVAVAVDVRARCFYGLGYAFSRFRATSEGRVADCETLARVPAYVAACIRGGVENLPKQ